LSRTPIERIDAVVMAAGAGRRMGCRPKSLLLRDGTPLIERTIGLLLGCGVEPVAVVLGHHAAAIEPVLQGIRAGLPDPAALRWALNPAPDAGQGSSLRTGLAALPDDLQAVLVALADQPLLRPEDVQALLAAWHRRDPHASLLVPRFEGRPGHPVIFDAAVRAAVMQARGSAGVREWRMAHPEQMLWLPVTHPRHVIDVDSPADLPLLAAQHGVHLRWSDEEP